MTPSGAARQPHQGVYIHACTCTCGKRGYLTRGDAKKVIREMRRAKKTRSDRVNAYRCQTGTGYWHVGHGEHPARPNLNSPNLRFLGEGA